MKSSRRKLIEQLRAMEIKLHYQQAAALKYKRTFTERIPNFRLAILMAMLPAFLWGWKIGRTLSFGKVVMQLVRLGLLTTASYAKQQLLLSYKK